MNKEKVNVERLRAGGNNLKMRWHGKNELHEEICDAHGEYQQNAFPWCDNQRYVKSRGVSF